MFRVWAREFKSNKMLRDMTVEDSSTDTRTHKVFHAVTKICREFDLGEPLWLDTNIREFRRHSQTRFHQDNFIEVIDFDYLELRVIEED